MFEHSQHLPKKINVSRPLSEYKGGNSIYAGIDIDN